LRQFSSVAVVALALFVLKPLRSRRLAAPVQHLASAG